MRIFRLSKATQPPYSGKGAEVFGGRWNSKGTRVLYMSESRALALLEILVHLTTEVPDRYVLGGADLPSDLEISNVSESDLSAGWRTELPLQQIRTREIGDAWVRTGRTAVLSVPSVIVDERNFLLNPSHADFRRIAFLVPKPFEFDSRFFDRRSR